MKKNAILQQLKRQRVGNHRAITAAEEANQTTGVDKATNLGWDLLSTQEWLQLV
jgi:hypothetical protein